MTIVLQRQVDNVTCVSACAAMLMGRPVEAVVDEFHDSFQKYTIDLNTYLARNGVYVERVNHSHLQEGAVYILLVPSLNAPAQFHQVVADTRGDKIKIYDPAREGRQRYVAPGEAVEPGETEIITWVAEFRVLSAPAIGVV